MRISELLGPSSADSEIIRKMRPDSAAERAFLIPEILETILLNIPPRDLLVDVQRVNRTWHNTAKGSPAIQRLLFFEPCPEYENRDPEFSVLLNEAFPPFFNHNPDDDEHPKWTQESLSRIDWNSGPAKRDAYSRKEASWRQMLVVQPPITRINIFKSWSSMTGLGKVKGKIARLEGLRMGTLYDLVEEEAHAGTTTTSNDFDLEWHLPSVGDETPGPLSGRPIPPDAIDDNGSVTVYIIKSESWINIERPDFVTPDLTSFETYEEKQEAISRAYMSNARPHLVSKARKPVHIEWGEEKNIRRWR
jgi:hypothetical protein